MDETPVHQTRTPLFRLPADASVEDSCWKIITRTALWYTMIQPEKTVEDFVQGIVVPIMDPAGGRKRPIEVSVQAYQDSVHSEQVVRGLIRMILDIIIDCHGASIADEDGRPIDAWHHVTNAMFGLGYLEGQVLLEPTVTHVTKTQGNKGAEKRNEKFEYIRKFARDLASKGNYKSKYEAAAAIKDDVLEEAKRTEKQHGVRLSPDRARITIRGWLEGMEFASKD